ncbi:CLN3 protein-domain-containing protein [Geopyxis carbonaria]|nr:CLN3 protein-domain-containing protein [Geopyxis carbonaria]
MAKQWDAQARQLSRVNSRTRLDVGSPSSEQFKSFPKYNTFNKKKPTKPPVMLPRTMAKQQWVSTETRLFFSFWLFGTLVVMQFGVVVTAANDLVGNSAPPGLILFAYTLPSIIVRMFVPYIKFPDVKPSKIWSFFQSFTSSRASDYSRVNTPGPLTPGLGLKNAKSQEVNYTARLTICACSSFLGLQLLAWADNVAVRVLGIAFASLSSNLGDMSFFQLATRYPAMISKSFGGYAAGSGAAGLIGAALYTFFTSSMGVSPSSVLSAIGVAPTLMLATFLFLLPSSEAVAMEAQLNGISEDEDEEDILQNDEADTLISGLRLSDKLRLVKPMIWGYMAPLATVMLIENTTTQGILPTILWSLPLAPRFRSGIELFFTSTRAFYPFFFTIYQLAVFFGRTSITLFQLPSRSAAPYWGLCAIEVVCFIVMLSQSISMGFAALSLDDPDSTVRFSPLVIAAVVFTLGLCGGLCMSNTYWRVSKSPLPNEVWNALDTARSNINVGIVTPMLDDETEDYFNHNARPRLRKAYSSSNSLGISMLLTSRTPSPGLTANMHPRRPRVRSQQDETAVREFLISTIALPDTVAIMVASIVSLWLQPRLCAWQGAAGRHLCGAG